LLRKHGLGEGLLKKIASELDTGIIGDRRDLHRREKYFGKNTKPLP